MKANRLTRWLEWLFWRKLCPQPDKPILGSTMNTQRVYNWTGRIAGIFHRINCERCREHTTANTTGEAALPARKDA